MDVTLPTTIRRPTALRRQMAAMRRLLYFAVALGLGVLAHRLTDSSVPRDALILYIVAGVIFSLAAEPPSSWPTLPLRRSWPRPAMIVALGSLAVGLAAFVLLWQNLYSRAGFWLWLISWPVFLIAAFWEGPSSGDQPVEPLRSRLPRLAFQWEWGLLALIFIVALFMRLWQIDTIPNGCQSDECNNGLDALKWLRGNPYTPYAETNEGQATLFTYIIALFFKLFGATVPVMRTVPAVIGTLTVLALFFLVRDLFGSRPALVASGLLATARWHVTFSRIVYELIMVPLVILLLGFFLLRALREGKRRYWALAGVCVSLGLNTYTAFRLVPFAVIAFLLYWLAVHRDRWLRDLEGIGVMAVGAFLSILPLGIYIVQNWRTFTSRINHISIARDIERAGGSLEPFWTTVKKTLYIFHYKGDWAALNNLPNEPLLDAVVGILFVLGLLYALRYIYRPLPLLAISGLIIIGSAAVLSTAAEAPTARRTIGTLPFIYTLAGFVIYSIWRAMEEAWAGRGERVVAMGMAAMVGLVGISNANIYFSVQAKDPSVWIAFSGYDAAVGTYLRSVVEGVRVYLSPTFDGHSAVRFISDFRQYTPLNVGLHIPVRDDPPGGVIYLVEEVDRPIVDLLQQVYLQGELEEHRDPYGRILFLTYSVSHAELTATRGLPGEYWPGNEAEGEPALQRSAGPLKFDWRESPPLSPPFVAHWEGSLLVPTFGEYTLRLTAEGSGSATLTLDSTETLEAQGETTETQQILPSGFHLLKIEYQSGEAPARFALTWEGPSAMDAIPLSNLYASLPAARNGLVGYYYPNMDWSGSPSLIQRDPFIAPNNPIPEPYSIAWRGKIAAPREGVYAFGTRSDDGSYVYIDGQLVVDNGGQHGSEYREGTIELSEGFHDVEVRYFQLGGSRQMQFWWRPPGGGQEKVPSRYLFPLESGEIPADLVLPPPPPPPPAQTETAEPSQQPAQQPEAQPPSSQQITAPLLTVQPLWQIGTCGAGNNQFQSPRGLAVDAAGNVYVADSGNHRLVKLSPAGEWVQTWGRLGSGEGQFDEPFDVVAMPDGTIAVVESVGQRFQRFSADGRFLNVFGGGLSMYRPRGLGVDGDGNLYVADTGGVRWLKINAEGRILEQYGGPEQVLGSGQPTDVTVGSDGALYLIEASNGTAWKIVPNRTPLNIQAAMPASTLDGPHLAFGPDDLLYVADPEGARVIVYDANLNPVGQFGSQGSGPLQFRKPIGVAVGNDGKVYVTDSQACRVQVFSPIER